MKKPLLYLITMFSFWQSCQETVNPDQINTKEIETITWTSIDNEEQLNSVLNIIGFEEESSGLRKNAQGLSVLDQHILKVLQKDSTNYTYSFFVKTDTATDNSFTNLTIQRLDSGYLAFYQRYVPKKGSSDNIESFSGDIERYSLSGKFLGLVTLENGLMLENSNGRLKNLYWCITDVTITEICSKYQYYYDYPSLSYKPGPCIGYTTVIEYEYGFCSGGGGDSSGTGSYVPDEGEYLDTYHGGGGSATGGTTFDNPLLGVISEEEAMAEIFEEHIYAHALKIC